MPQNRSKPSDADEKELIAPVRADRVSLHLRLPGLIPIGVVTSKRAAEVMTRLIAALQEIQLSPRAGDLLVELLSSADALDSIELSGRNLAGLEAAVRKLAITPGVDRATSRLGPIRISLHFTERGFKQIASEETGGLAAGTVTDRIVRSYREHVERQLDDLPQDFATRRAHLRSLDSATRESYARAFQTALNAEARLRPQVSYEEKKALAKWVNAELREIGLALRCPKTGEPAILRGAPASTGTAGRFHIEVTDDRGVRHRTVTSATLPPLVLRPDELSRAPYGERVDRGR